jgi:hypothetical protein
MKKCLLFIGFIAAGSALWAQWGPDVRLTNAPGHSYTTYNNTYSIAVSGNNIHVIWYDQRDGNWEIYYKRSTDNGATWGADTRLTNNAASSWFSAVAVSGNNIHVLWWDSRNVTNWEVYYKRSIDNGATWGPETRLTNGAVLGSVYRTPASVAVSGNNIHVTWHDLRNGDWEIYYKRSTDNGTTWGVDTRLTNYPGYSLAPSVAVSGNNIHTVWYDQRDGNGEIYTKRSTDNGVTWGVDTRLTNNPSFSGQNSVAVSGSNVHVVWNDTRDGNYEIYYKHSTDNGDSWDIDTRLTNNPNYSGYPWVAVSGSNIHTFWQDNRDGNWEIYYKRSINNGVTWEADSRLTNYPGESGGACGTVAGNNIHVVWKENRDGNYEIYYKRNLIADLFVQTPLLTGSQPASNQVWCGAAYTPYDTVVNNGPTTASTITTWSYIDTWSNSQSIPSLTSGARARNNFTSWTASRTPGATHSRRDTTYAGSPVDPDLSNNKVTASYTAVYDGQAVSIDAPADTVFTGLSYIPRATVKNNSGAGAADFSVTCTISPAGFSNTQSVTNLAAGSSVQVSFPSWTAPLRAGTVETLTVAVSATADVNTANNTLTKTVFVKGDIGATEAVAPLDTVYVNTEYNPTVRVKNLTPGITEPFDIVCRILDESGGIEYLDTRKDSLDVSAEKLETFKEWMVGPDTGVIYELQAYTLLPGDCDPVNDKLIWYVVSAVQPSLDVGVASLDDPTGNIQVGKTYAPKATVRNYGTATTTFNVTCTIGGHTSTRGVTNLAKNGSQQLTFDDWTPTTEGDFTMTVITQLADANPHNDTMSQTLTARDVNEPLVNLPKHFALESGRPNPFAALSDIRYALPVNTAIILAVYDATGTLVKTLAKGVAQAGYKSVRWDGRDNAGNPVPNGLYFVRMQTPQYSAMEKIVLTR